MDSKGELTGFQTVEQQPKHKQGMILAYVVNENCFFFHLLVSFVLKTNNQI